jgi:hypothetical protein
MTTGCELQTTVSQKQLTETQSLLYRLRCHPLLSDRLQQPSRLASFRLPFSFFAMDTKKKLGNI